MKYNPTFKVGDIVYFCRFKAIVEARVQYILVNYPDHHTLYYLDGWHDSFTELDLHACASFAIKALELSLKSNE